METRSERPNRRHSTITKTVNGGVSATLDITKIFGIGADAGFSYSWSTSDAKSVAENSECPKGGVECGLKVTASVVKITGKKVEKQSGCASGNGEKSGDFEIVAPLRKGKGNDDMTAVQTYEACYVKCSDDDGSCAAVKEAAIDKCP